jgi:uncharacterized protein (DUF1810 family)
MSTPRQVQRLHRHLVRTISAIESKLLTLTVSSNAYKNALRKLKYSKKKLSQLPKIGVSFVTHYRSILYAPRQRPIAHCVATDLRMGRGAAADLANTFPKIRRVSTTPTIGRCCLAQDTGRRFINIVTKKYSSGKPTYRDFVRAIHNFRDIIVQHKITSVSITRLGCGKDRLNWDSQVFPLLKTLFQDIPVLFHVYVT